MLFAQANLEQLEGYHKFHRRMEYNDRSNKSPPSLGEVGQWDVTLVVEEVRAQSRTQIPTRANQN